MNHMFVCFSHKAIATKIKRHKLNKVIRCAPQVLTITDPILQLLPVFLLTLIYPFSPHPVPQLFLIIQVSSVYPTISTAWSATSLEAQTKTPLE